MSRRRFRSFIDKTLRFTSARVYVIRRGDNEGRTGVPLWAGREATLARRGAEGEEHRRGLAAWGGDGEIKASGPVVRGEATRGSCVAHSFVYPVDPRIIINTLSILFVGDARAGASVF